MCFVRFIDESFRCCSFPLYNCFANISGNVGLSIVGTTTVIFFNSFGKYIRIYTYIIETLTKTSKHQVYNNYIRSDKIIDEISSEISNVADITQIM